ncbi:camp-dependent protein kinase regulatory subunit [Chytriomyces sp. MP71]|nr:camp-dependent protein kinase regulatory subunit [Chytriomyces sp. MP71]
MALSTADRFVVAELPDILKDLSREVLRMQPKDVYQFCAMYFFNKLADQRKELLDIASRTPEAVYEESILHRSDSIASTIHIAAQPSPRLRPRGSAKNPDADTVRDSEDEEEAAPLPVTRGRRSSVFAESMMVEEEAADVAEMPIVVNKTDSQKRRIRASIQDNFLFRSCNEEQCAAVVDAMAEKRAVTGEEIIRQGGVGDFFYFIESGSLDVYVAKPGDEEVQKVYEYADGDCFGELALMYNAPRAATVVATSLTVLWALDRLTFRKILMTSTSRKRRLYEGFLEEVTLLSSLEPYERLKIADILESRIYHDGEEVIVQGERGETFFIIESGEASVTKLVDGVEHSLPNLKKGEYFGELALLNNEPRQASIRAAGKLKVATMDKSAFVRLLGPLTDIIKRNANDYASVKSATGIPWSSRISSVLRNRILRTSSTTSERAVSAELK